jgi:chorismate lyase / 3-hydroxybenzoate synthase
MESPNPERLPGCLLENPRSFARRSPQREHLGVIHYSSSPRPPYLKDGVPTLSMHMTHSNKDEFVEVWTAGRPCRSGEHDGLVYAHDGEYLLCAGHVPATEDYREGTRSAYLKAFDLIEDMRYRHVFRNVEHGVRDQRAQ